MQPKKRALLFLRAARVKRIDNLKSLVSYYFLAASLLVGGEKRFLILPSSST